MSREAFFSFFPPIYKENFTTEAPLLLQSSRKSQGYCLRGKREETQQKAEEFIPEKQEVAP